MKKEAEVIDRPRSRGEGFLICDPEGEARGLNAPAEEWVSSPLRCLARAVENTPAIILIRFGNQSLLEEEDLLELVAILKSNRHTRHIPVLALFKGKHRQLIAKLHQLGVDYGHHVGAITLGGEEIRAIIAGLGPDDSLARQLDILCPFLHYSRIDDGHEMTVCGAYLDRMVLGGRRLHEICQTEDHLRCEFYLQPRRSQS
ncbi:MAG: hypothetical protein KKC76_13275 [Proteobacteria bacterium]|nr:hypothetical protein [Pseudomonadota bacterium]MBU4297957.1 hypothetical protein [Pseudomonadota bacterium]MCG2749206.1 hypothetical protein [Desulfobulbaceae bacterium]